MTGVRGVPARSGTGVGAAVVVAPGGEAGCGGYEISRCRTVGWGIGTCGSPPAGVWVGATLASAAAAAAAAAASRLAQSDGGGTARAPLSGCGGGLTVRPCFLLFSDLIRCC